MVKHWSDCAKNGGYYPDWHPLVGEHYEGDDAMPCTCGGYRWWTDWRRLLRALRLR